MTPLAAAHRSSFNPSQNTPTEGPFEVVRINRQEQSPLCDGGCRDSYGTRKDATSRVYVLGHPLARLCGVCLGAWEETWTGALGGAA